MGVLNTVIVTKGNQSRFDFDSRFSVLLVLLLILLFCFVLFYVAVTSFFELIFFFLRERDRGKKKTTNERTFNGIIFYLADVCCSYATVLDWNPFDFPPIPPRVFLFLLFTLLYSPAVVLGDTFCM